MDIVRTRHTHKWAYYSESYSISQCKRTWDSSVTCVIVFFFFSKWKKKRNCENGSFSMQTFSLFVNSMLVLWWPACNGEVKVSTLVYKQQQPQNQNSLQNFPVQAQNETFLLQILDLINAEYAVLPGEGTVYIWSR